jgi:hypothetical protein
MPLLRFDDVIKQFKPNTRPPIGQAPGMDADGSAGSEKHANVVETLVGHRKKPTPGSSEIMDLEDLFKRIEESAGAIVAKLQESLGKKTPGQKLMQRIKDLAPVITSLAAVIVTITIGYSSCKFNERQAALTQAQAAVTQADLKRSWLADFTDSEDAKRKVGAIRLAAYGDEALPAIRDALGINNELIREGGILTALTVCRSKPTTRSRLLKSMLDYFEESNPSLRLGVLDFYIDASKELTAGEMAEFCQHLKGRLGSNASNCVNEDGEFALKAATFLALGSFVEAKTLLLDIIRNCPHEGADDKYRGARNQAVTSLAIVSKQQRLSKSERDEIINFLRAFETNASAEFKGNLEAAINQIQKIQNP